MSNFEIENHLIKNILDQGAAFMLKLLPKGWGFTLFIFNYGPGGAMFYASKSERKQMIKALREFIQKMEN